jgi:hypothetical protein
LKGYLNDFSLAETFKTISAQIPRLYQNVTINLDEVCFTSEKTVIKFIDHLNDLTSRARNIEVRIGSGNKYLVQVLQKYDLKIPQFSISG